MKHTKVEVLDGAQNAESHLDTGGSEEAVNPVVKGLGGNPKCLSDDGDAVSKESGESVALHALARDFKETEDDLGITDNRAAQAGIE